MATPQVNLNTAYPGAVSGDAVLDQATGNYWVYNGSTWQNVGPILGQTIAIQSETSSWNEVIKLAGTSIANFNVTVFPYSLIPKITEVPLGIYTSVTAYKAGSAAPDVATIQIRTFEPSIDQGIVVYGEMAAIAIAGIAPTVDAKLGVIVKPGVSTIDVAAPVDLDIATAALQVQVSYSVITIGANSPSVIAVPDAFFSSTVLVVKSVGEAGTTGPTGRYFPDLSSQQRTVRVTEYTKSYYKLLDGSTAPITGPGDLLYNSTPFLFQPKGPQGATTFTETTGHCTDLARYVWDSTANGGNGGYIPGGTIIQTNAAGSPLTGVDYSAYFDGTTTGNYVNNYIKGTVDGPTFNLGSANDNTVEVWCYQTEALPDYTDSYILMCGDSVTNSSFHLGSRSRNTFGNPGPFCGSANGNVSNSILDFGMPPLNQWYHVCMQTNYYYSQSYGQYLNVIRIYLNGKCIGEGNLSLYNNSNYSTRPFYIGAGVTQVGVTGFKGYIGAIRVTKGTRRYDNDVAWNYGPVSVQKFTPPTLELPNYYGGPVESSFVNFLNNHIDSSTGVIYSTAAYKWNQRSMLFYSKTSWLQASYVSSTAFGSGPFTMEAWIRFTELTTTDQWLFNNLAINSVTVSLVNIDLGASSPTETVTWTHGGTIVAGTWLHIAVTRNSSNILRLYVNGVQVDTDKSMTNGTFNTPVYKIGAKYYVSGVAHTCSLRAFVQEVRITKALRYTGNFSVPTETFISLAASLPTDESAVIPSSATKLLVPGYLSTGGSNLKDFSTNNLTISPVLPGSSSVAGIASATDPFGIFRSVINLKSKGYFTIGSSSSLIFNKNPFCIEFWIYFTGHPGGSGMTAGCYILDGAPSTSPRLLIDWDDAVNGIFSTATFGLVKGEAFTLGSSFASFGNQMKLNKWYHVAYTRDSLGEARLFINGKMLTSPQFLHDLDANYTWTNDGYQDFTTALNSIGVNQANSPNYNRAFNGYIAEISVIAGYAKYLKNFDVPTQPFALVSSGISVTTFGKIDITAAKPTIVAGVPYVVGVSTATVGAGATLTLPLPSGTTTDDVTYVIISYPRNSAPGIDPTLLGNDLTALTWTREKFTPNYLPLNVPAIYVWNKVFSTTPATAEQTLKLPIANSVDTNWKGYYVRTDNTNVMSYTVADTCPERTVTPSTIVAKAERGAAGTYTTGAYSGTTCDGTFTKTDVLGDGLQTTWLTTARNTIGSMWLHCGINWTPEGCCTTDVCGDKVPNRGTANGNDAVASFSDYSKYIRIRVQYCRTNWDGTTLNAAGSILTGGNTSYLRYSGHGLKLKPSEPGNAFIGTTTLGVNAKSLYHNYANATTVEARWAPFRTMPTGANGEIRYATWWASFYEFQLLLNRYDYANGGYYDRLNYSNYIPGALFGYEGGGGGPSVRSGVGIVSFEMDLSPSMIFEPHYLYCPGSNNMKSNSGTSLLTTCSFSFGVNLGNILYDNNTSTFVAQQSGVSQSFEWHSGGVGTFGLYNCCTGGTPCDGDQIWDIPWRGDQVYDNYNGFKSGDYIRFTVTIVRAYYNGGTGTPAIKVGGAESSIKLTGLGWMTEWGTSSTTTSVPSWVTVPTLVTDSNGLVTTHTFDIPLYDSTNAPTGWIAPLWGSPLKAVWQVTNGGTVGSGTETSCGIVEMKAQLIPQGYTGAVNTQGITGHAITVRNTSPGFRAAASLNPPSPGTASSFFSASNTEVGSSRTNAHCSVKNNSTTTGIAMPIPISLKRNSLWINYTVTNVGRNSADFNSVPSVPEVPGLTVGSIIGPATPTTPTAALSSRLIYGTKPGVAATAPASCPLQTFTGNTTALSLSLVIDNLTTDRIAAIYLALLEADDALYDGLLGNPTYEAALTSLISTMRSTGLTKVIPIVGFRNLSYIRELNSFTSETSVVDDVEYYFPKREQMFKNFKTNNPTLGIDASSLYNNDEPDFSPAYGIRGNPQYRSYIEPWAYSNGGATKIPTRYDYFPMPNIVVTKSPLLSIWKGGTRKTCRTENYGYGEGFYSSGTTRILTKCYSADSNRGPRSTVFFINTSTDNATTGAWLYGEIGFTQTFIDKADPFDMPAAINLSSYPLTDNSAWSVNHTNASTCLGSYPSAYRYGYIQYVQTDGAGTNAFSTTVNSNSCLDICSGDFLSYPCQGHWNVATAFLKNGRDELVNPAYSSARIGALSSADTIYRNYNTNTPSLSTAITTYINAVKSILLP